MHNIDIKKYEIRTDMAIDLAEKNKDIINTIKYEKKGVKVTWIKLDKDNKINKKPGNYLTL